MRGNGRVPKRASIRKKTLGIWKCESRAALSAERRRRLSAVCGSVAENVGPAFGSGAVRGESDVEPVVLHLDAFGLDVSVGVAAANARLHQRVHVVDRSDLRAGNDDVA